MNASAETRSDEGDLATFIRALPKAELHLHIEGSLEPAQMFAFARRNRVDIPFSTVEEVRAAYAFSNLQDFLDIYYQGANVLRTEEDFQRLALAYFERLHADGGRHAEIFSIPKRILTADCRSPLRSRACWPVWRRRRRASGSPQS
ncbi:MAG: hypothetical protein R3C52_09665 [Hyphomonadaceae bacterium]